MGGPVREFRDGGSRVIEDGRFSPVVIRTHFGAATEKLLRESAAWLREYMSSLPSHAKIVIISDASAAPVADSTLRKVAAEEMKKLEPQMRAHNADCIVILNSAVLRGALKAISWLTSINLIPAKDLEDAFRLAGELLAKVGQTLPLGLTGTTYRAPTTLFSTMTISKSG
jgi:hypothetical protein